MMASLKRVLDSKISDEVLNSLSWKREVSTGKLLFEQTVQAPSPSKDFVQLKITDKGLIWRKWKISIRGLAQGKAPTPQPSEVVLTHKDFLVDDNLQVDIERTFGSRVLSQVHRIVAGSHDNLSRLPERVLHTICLYLDLQSLTHLSQTNAHLREACCSESLWKLLYYQHQGVPGEEVAALAGEIGWKTVFFMNKLQLQKEVSRKRRLQSSGSMPTEQLTAFLTQ